jgi:ABC-type transporter Mla MlaB component
MQNQCGTQGMRLKTVSTVNEQLDDVFALEIGGPSLRTQRDGSQEMLRIDIESSDTFATLICGGRLTLGVETETLRTIVQSRTEENIRVDLAGIERIDASGLGLMVELQAWAREDGRTLTFVDLPDHIWRLVILTKLYGTLEISYSDLPHVQNEQNGMDCNELIA